MNKSFLKRNKYILIAYLIIIFITFLSIYNYFSTNYIFQYNKIKKVCYEDKNMSSELCDAFTKYDMDLEEYINDESNTASGILKSRGFASVSTTIIMSSPYSALQFLSPLLISLAIVGTIHEMYSSGMFKNYIQRIKYKELLKILYKKTFIISLITPLSLAFIYIFCGIITNFQIVYNTNLFSEWFLENFVFYIISTLIIQYLFNIFCVNVCLFAIAGNKNTILSILKGYLYFYIFYLFIYLIVYGLCLSRIMGVNVSYEFFNITIYFKMFF